MHAPHALLRRRWLRMLVLAEKHSFFLTAASVILLLLAGTFMQRHLLL